MSLSESRSCPMSGKPQKQKSASTNPLLDCLNMMDKGPGPDRGPPPGRGKGMGERSGGPPPHWNRFDHSSGMMHRGGPPRNMMMGGGPAMPPRPPPLPRGDNNHGGPSTAPTGFISVVDGKSGPKNLQKIHGCDKLAKFVHGRNSPRKLMETKGNTTNLKRRKRIRKKKPKKLARGKCCSQLLKKIWLELLQLVLSRLIQFIDVST